MSITDAASRTDLFVYHLHLPKTGGSALGLQLLRTFCPSCAALTHEARTACRARGYIAPPRSQDPCDCDVVDADGTRSRCSDSRIEHSASWGASQRHCDSLAAARGRTCRYVITLREPLARMLSQYRHCARQYARGQRVCDHYGLARPPGELDNATTFYRWVFDAELTTRKLHIKSHMGAMSRNVMAEWLSSDEASGSGHHAGLATAKRRLNATWLVGVTEDLDGLMRCVHSHASLGAAASERRGGAGAATRADAAEAPAAPGVDPSRIDRHGHIHAASEPGGARTLTLDALPPELRDSLARRNALDIELHAYARELYRERCGGGVRDAYRPHAGSR